MSRPEQDDRKRRTAPALLICLGFALIAALPAAAGTEPAVKAADPARLEELRKAIEEQETRRAEAEAKAAAAEQEVAALKRQLVEVAARVQAREGALSDSEERLAGLSAAAAVIEARLSERRQELADMLTALQRLDRHPPPALAVRPDDVLAAIRSAMLLGTVVPELEGQAARLRKDLADLQTVREEILAERKTLDSATLALAEERDRLDSLLSRKLALQSALRAKAEAESQALARLSEEAQTLGQLIEKLEARAASRLPESRPPAAVPSEQAPAAAQGETRLAALPPALPPDFGTRRFSQARGMLRPPAEGRLVKNFGVANEAGGKTQGITLETRPDAQITAPFDGQIVFAGPFRRYGQLLIIAVGEGYHVVLAGMARINGEVGQSLLAGEPVGTMATAGADGLQETPGSHANPMLYLEIRKDGEPIDPLPWLVVDNRKVRS